MPKLPTINKMQFGIIDEVYMNALRDGAEGFMQMRPALNEVLAEYKRLKSKPFLAKITAKVAIAEVEFERFNTILTTVDVAWKYEFETMQLSLSNTDPNATEIQLLAGDNSYTTEMIQDSNDIGDEGCVSGYAYNLAELANEEFLNEIIFGVKVTGESYPAGFIPVGMQVGDYVLLTKFNSGKSCTGYLFDRQGTHDGDCEAE